MKLKSLLSIVIFCIFLAQIAFAQSEGKFDFYTRGSYRPEVSRPQSILRFDVGEQHTTYAQMEMVVNAIEIPVLLASGYFFRYSKNGTNALVFDENPKTPLTISGFVWEGNTERLLKGTAYLIDEPQGRGHTIMFADDIFFRGIFRSASRSFFNSIVFNGTF